MSLIRRRKPCGSQSRIELGVVCAVMAVACHGGSAPPGDLTPQRDRITDESVERDAALFDSWTVRLVSTQAQRDSVSRYHRAKAGAWLLLAREEYGDNDRTGIVDAAFFQATSLIEQYEGGMVALEPAVVVTGSRRVRPDLWDMASELKGQPGFRCAASTVARLEVRLVWAGNEDLTCGVDDPRPHLDAAEQLAHQAKDRAARCPRVVSVTAMPLALRFMETFDRDTLEIPILFLPGETSVTLEDVTFGLGSANLTAAAQEVLNGVALSLNDNESIRVEVSGHTDNTGARAVNMRLSQERAEAVREYLISRRVAPDRLVARGYGPDQPAADNATLQGRSLNRRVELSIIENE